MKALITLILTMFSASPLLSAEPPFQIAIVPERSTEQGAEISWAADSKEIFYVVLTNTTDEPQRIFETWNSWGYQAISFELTLASSKKVKMAMRDQVFTKNFASTSTIPPKGHFVFPITLNDDWQGRPEFEKEGPTTVQLKAIYEISPTFESKEYAVWAGKVESEELTVKINHW